jgi:hypothetical protein
MERSVDMFWDDLIRRWRGENPSLGPHALAGAAGHVAVAPAPRRRSRRGLLLALVALLVVLLLALSTGKVRSEPTSADRPSFGVGVMSAAWSAA